jgi:methylated-DNA-protein-cysteine methyltransferase related protein
VTSSSDGTTLVRDVPGRHGAAGPIASASVVPMHRAHDDGTAPAAPGDLATAVARVLASTTPGTVLSYGEVAAEAGRPGAARAVGRLLARDGATLPWWRVVTADGRLVPGHEPEQARRLRAEGVACDERRVRREDRAASRPSGTVR